MGMRCKKLSNYRKSNFGFDIYNDINLMGKRIYSISTRSVLETEAKTRLSDIGKNPRIMKLSSSPMRFTIALSKRLYITKSTQMRN